MNTSDIGLCEDGFAPLGANSGMINFPDSVTTDVARSLHTFGSRAISKVQAVVPVFPMCPFEYFIECSNIAQTFLVRPTNKSTGGTPGANSKLTKSKTASMKKPTNRRAGHNFTFGDLVVAVSSVSRSSNETAAALSDLLESGRVRLTNNGRTIRARVS